MGLYKRIAMIETPEDRDDILDEIIDRYGDVPKPTSNLLSVALVRSAAKKCEMISVIEEATEVKIYPSVFDFEVWSELADIYKGRIRVLMSEKPTVVFKKQRGEDNLSVLHKLFCQYDEILQKYI